MDTASDVHTVWDRAKFTTYKPCNDSLSGINGQSLRVKGTGSVRYPAIVEGKLNEIILTNVHHVPAMDYNLLLIATLEQKGCSAAIANGRFDIMDDSDNEKILSGTRVGTSYLLDLKYSKTPHALKAVAILSKETGADTDDSSDYFSEDIVYSNGETAINSPITIPVLEAEAEAEIQLDTEDATQSNTEDAISEDEKPEPAPQPRLASGPRASARNKNRVNYRELAGQ